MMTFIDTQAFNLVVFSHLKNGREVHWDFFHWPIIIFDTLFINKALHKITVNCKLYSYKNLCLGCVWEATDR
jgi:hypothetical protein